MTKNELRIVFMGTPEFAVGTLSALVDGGYNVVAVVTQPDRPVGRHQQTLQPTAVKRYAVEHGLPVMQPEKMKDDTFVEQLRTYKADLQVVVAFRMLPEIVWAMPRYGTFNVHASLLPQYRGAAPINWAIINGETLTGITTFFLDRNIDTGRVIMQKTLAIGDDDNAGDIHDALMTLGAQTAIETIDSIIAADGNITTTEQARLAFNSQLSTLKPNLFACQSKNFQLKPAPKIFKETCRINWAQTARQVHDFVRGLSPYPGAWTELHHPDGKVTVLKVYKTTKMNDSERLPVGTITTDGQTLCVAATDGHLRIDELQPAGKRRMAARDFVNGFRNLDACTIS